MGLIEAILLGLHFEKLQKPIVFVAMLIGLIAFSIFGMVMAWLLIEGLVTTDTQLDWSMEGGYPGLVLVTLIFWGLAAACAYFIKRCFE